MLTSPWRRVRNSGEEARPTSETIKLRDEDYVDQTYTVTRGVRLPLASGTGYVTAYIPDGTEQITDTQQHDVSEKQYAQVVDADLVPGNIKNGVDILGVTGTYTGGGGTNKLVQIVSGESVALTADDLAGADAIRSSAFLDCTGLRSIIIPDSVTSIGNYAFSGCTNLGGIIIPDGVTSMGNYTFRGCSLLASVTIGDGVTSIGNYTFANCTNLGYVRIPDSVTFIDSSAFSNCSAITSITIPDGVTNMGNSVFYGCSSLRSIIIPDGVVVIGGSTFYRCTNLSSADIGSGVTSMGTSAFYGCSNLQTLTCRATTPPTIVSTTLSGVPSTCAIYVPADSVSAYQAASYWSARASYIQAIPTT